MVLQAVAGVVTYVEQHAELGHPAQAGHCLQGTSTILRSVTTTRCGLHGEKALKIMKILRERKNGQTNVLISVVAVANKTDAQLDIRIDFGNRGHKTAVLGFSCLNEWFH